MKTFSWANAGLIATFILICWVYLSGISSVPFHPDESTQIFMSADVTQNPVDLSYSVNSTLDGRMRYRLIDSPLTHTLIGWGLFLQGQQPVQADWNWSLSWDENKTAGALPAGDVLLAARWSVAWLFPLSILFLFLIARKIDGIGSAILSILLLASNALILLHTRRAMAESALICTFCAAVWWMVSDQRKIWLSAIPLGLAINTKQTSIPLVGIGLLQVFFQPSGNKKEGRIFHVCFFVFIIFFLTWILNPVFWKSPLPAIQEGIAQRADLSERMKVDYHTSNNLFEQTAFLVARVFIQPPAISDVLNYQDATKTQERSYFGQPINNLFRGFSGGEVFFGLTLFGFGILIRRYFSNRNADRYPLGVFLAITIICILVILVLTPVPFQRYYIILVPLFIVAQSVAIRTIGLVIYKLYKEGLPRFGSPLEN